MLILELTSVSLIILLSIITFIVSPSIFDANQLKLENVSFDHVRLGLVLAIFSFVGFESATSLGEEAKNPLKIIPRALIVSALFVGTFFIFSSYSQVLGFIGNPETLDKSSAPLNYLAVKGHVGFLIPFISLGAVISFFACIMACINAGARILFHMSHHGLFHNSVSKAHAKNKTPHVAVSIASFLTFIPAAILSGFGVGAFDIYGWIGTIATLGFIVTYITISVAAPVYLRNKGQLTIKGIIIPVLSIIFLFIALIGNLYPLPPYPYSILPYLLFAYLLIGVVWFAVVSKRNPEIGNSIRSDIKDIDKKHALDSASL
jgi:amino acid transporter